MKYSSTRMKALAAVACFSLGVSYAFIRVKASPTAVEQPALFGILGITRGQTARINVANLSSPDNPLFPPDPCRVTMSFVDADGNVLLNNAGQPVRREVTLEPGHSAFLQINGDNLVDRGQARLTFRPVVVVTPPDPNSPPDPCIPTVEVISNTTGRTSLLLGGFPPPCSARQ
jgi:hypothetical protein